MTFKHDLIHRLAITMASLAKVRNNPGSRGHGPLAMSSHFRAGEMMVGGGDRSRSDTLAGVAEIKL